MVSRGVTLNVHRVSKRFDKLNALDDVSFTVERGSVVSVLGPSGAGKTTLLRCLAGVEPISNGRIEFSPHGVKAPMLINGKGAVSRVARDRIGMVFQELHLWPHMTVLENLIEAPIRVGCLAKQEATERIVEMCRELGIVDQLRKLPHQLSIGQQQRAAIIRSWAMDPEVLLLDEITSALDPENTRGIVRVIESLARSSVTLILVTHNISLARALCDKFLFVFEGKLVSDSTCLDPDELSELPDRVQRFLGST